MQNLSPYKIFKVLLASNSQYEFFICGESRVQYESEIQIVLSLFIVKI